jgi:hypothetical protein
MAITFPLTAPTNFREIRFTAVNITGRTQSQFTGEQDIYQWPGEWLEAEVEYPPLERDDAEAVIAFLEANRGGVGTFLLGPERPGRTQQGTAASVTVNGGGQSGITLAMSGTGTIAVGDFLQLGSGSTSRLHKNLTALTLAGTADIFPRLRESPSHGASVTLSSPKGLFRLAENRSKWTVDAVRLYGISFKAIEAI